jgi:tetratricopeptide (TPR) repeat protein
MVRLLSKNSAALFVAVLLLLPACMPQKRRETDFELKKRTDIDLVLRESKQDIRKRDFDGALGVYDAALRKYTGDRGLLKDYLNAAEDILDAADDALDREEFAASGRTYAVLLRNYPHFQDIHRELSFDRDYLEARLKECSDRLSERALVQYRQGNLHAAISLWKNILEFDPRNVGVKKAIDTATAQLKNLQQKTE